MFGEAAYRFPQLYILWTVIKNYKIEICLQIILVIKYMLGPRVYLPYLTENGALLFMVMMPVPFFIIGTAMVWILRYHDMKGIANQDSEVKERLTKEYPYIDQKDYIAWATMEAYKMYYSKHKSHFEYEILINRRAMLFWLIVHFFQV